MPFSILLTAESKDKDALLEVKEVLESIPGTYLVYPSITRHEETFIFAPKQEGELSESEFFAWMAKYRSELRKKISAEDILVVLTSREIANRHFNGIDFERRSIFVDLNHWQQHYLPDSPPKYPIAYHVFISILLVIYFKSYRSAASALHFFDKGCILDYNVDKSKVELKVLTARICADCIDTLLAINQDTNLLAYFRSGLEKIRRDMVEGEYYNRIKPKPMKLTFGRDHVFHFEGLGYMRLDPTHSLVYLYFLKNKDVSIYFNEVKKDVEFLDHVFRELKWREGRKDGENIHNVVMRLCGLRYQSAEIVENPTNGMSERISLINKELTKVLGTFGLQSHFQIHNQEGRHRVSREIDFRDDSGLLDRAERSILKKKRGGD